MTVARIVLAAMLFSVLSPAIAAALFPDRPDILGRMLAVPAIAAPAAPQDPTASDDDACPHESMGHATHGDAQATHHGHSSHGSHEDTGHADHGTFCSFCLAASAVVTLPAAASTDPAVLIADVPASSGHAREPAPPQLSSHRSRGPPSLS